MNKALKLIEELIKEHEENNYYTNLDDINALQTHKDGKIF